MSQRGHLIVGLDIGSSNVRTVIAQETPGEASLKVVGVGVSPALGMRRGSIVDIEAAARAVNASIEQAEAMAGDSVDSVVVNIGGTEIFSQEAKGVVAIGKADGEVLDDDLQRVIHAAETSSLPLNKEIIHILPRSYRLDDQKNIKNPLGMYGVRLEVDALLIGGSAPHLKNIAKCIEQVGVSLDTTVAQSLAASMAVLNTKQKELGAVVVDIGNTTTSIAVFEDGDVLHIKTLPVGASHITNDIAIGLRTSIDTAEQVKILFGTALIDDVDEQEDIDLSQIDSQEEGLVSRQHVAEIIEARVEEILRFVDAELKTIGRSGLLPAGVIITGGGSKLPGVIEMAKEVLRLPAQIGYPQSLGGILDKVDDPEFSTAVGLVLWAHENVGDGYGSVHRDMMPESAKVVYKKMRGWFDKFLP